MYNITIKRRWYNSINNFKKYQENSYMHHFLKKIAAILNLFLQNSITGKLIGDHTEIIKESIVFSIYDVVVKNVIRLFDSVGDFISENYKHSFCKAIVDGMHLDRVQKSLVVFINIAIIIAYICVKIKFELNIVFFYILSISFLGSLIIYFMEENLKEIVESSFISKSINFLLSADGEKTTKKWSIYLIIFAVPFFPKTLTMALILAVSVLNIFINIGLKKKPLKTEIIDFAVVFMLVVMIVATILSTDRIGSARDLIIHISAILLMFNMLTSIETKNEFNSIVAAFVYTATLVALYGLYQYKTGIELDAAWVDAQNNPDLTARVYSVFGNPNILAEYLIMALPLSIGLLFSNKGLFKKFICLGCSGVLLLTLLLTFSRGGWLGFAIGFVIMALMFKIEIIWAMIPAGVLSLFILPDSIVNRILSIGNLGDSSNAYRIKIWKITAQMISDNWMLGVGLGYLPYKQNYINYIRTMKVCHAHNMILQAFAEMGVAGLFALLFIIVLFIKGIMMVKKHTTDSYIHLMIIAVAGSFFSVLGHGLTENILYLPRIVWTFWMIVGFGMVLMRINGDKEISSKGEIS